MSITFCETDNRFINKPLPDVKLLALINVNPDDRDYIRVVDEDESGLVCLHYLTPLTLEGQPDLNVLSRVGHVRGTIIDTVSEQVVCRSFPYTVEMVVDESSDGGLLLPGITAYEAKEGTIIRKYYWNDVWRVSTHRKLDAINSRWSGPSFGEVFNNLFEKAEKEHEVFLNTNLCYIFMILHPQNKLIYNVSEPRLVHISTFDRATDSFHDPCESSYGLTGIETPKKLNITTYDQVKELVGKAKSAEFSGIMLLNNISNPVPVKLVSKNYMDIKAVRGNERSLYKRYLQLRGTPQAEVLVNWYEDERDLFNNVEKSIHNLAKKLHLMYMDRFINKNIVQLPKEEFVFLSKCHEWHIQNRKSNIVTFDKVKSQLDVTPFYYVEIMLGRF